MGASPFDGIGITLTEPSLVARFRGVRRDLGVRLHGDMCTVEQARRYLFPGVVAGEQDGDTPSRSFKAAVGIGFIHGFIRDVRTRALQ